MRKAKNVISWNIIRDVLHLESVHVNLYIMLMWRLTWRPAPPWIGKLSPKALELSPLKKPTQKLYFPSKCTQPKLENGTTIQTNG